MRILVLSDLHLEFAAFNPSNKKLDVVVLAGDIHVGVKGIQWAQKAFVDTPVIYVAGNHEYYRQSYPDHLNKMRKTAQGTHVRFLENDSTTIDDVTFLGCTLWTNFELFGNAETAMLEAESAMSDYQVIQVTPGYRKLRPTDTLMMHTQSVTWLKKTIKSQENKKLIVVTHHAPSMLSVPERFKEDVVSAAFASPLNALVASSRARFWLHGHNHQAANYKIGDTQVLCNPRGYPDEPDTRFNPNLTIEL